MDKQELKIILDCYKNSFNELFAEVKRDSTCKAIRKKTKEKLEKFNGLKDLCNKLNIDTYTYNLEAYADCDDLIDMLNFCIKLQNDESLKLYDIFEMLNNNNITINIKNNPFTVDYLFHFDVIDKNKYETCVDMIDEA